MPEPQMNNNQLSPRNAEQVINVLNASERSIRDFNRDEATPLEEKTTQQITQALGLRGNHTIYTQEVGSRSNQCCVLHIIDKATGNYQTLSWSSTGFNQQESVSLNTNPNVNAPPPWVKKELEQRTPTAQPPSAEPSQALRPFGGQLTPDAQTTPPHIQKIHDLGQRFGIITMNQESSGTLAIIKTNPARDSAVLRGTIDIGKAKIQDGSWAEQAAPKITEELMSHVMGHYQGQGHQFLATGKMPENATQEFKDDFLREVKMVFGLRKDSPVEVHRRALASGNVALALYGKDGKCLAAVVFTKTGDSPNQMFKPAKATIFDNEALAKIAAAEK